MNQKEEEETLSIAVTQMLALGLCPNSRKDCEEYIDMVSYHFRKEKEKARLNRNGPKKI